MGSSIDAEKSVIHLSLKDENTVCIKKSISVDLATWDIVINWWHQECEGVAVTKNVISIPLGKFYNYLGWLRTHWVNNKRSYTVSEDLKKAVKKIKHDSALFDELLDNISEPDKFDTSKLDLIRTPTAFQTDNINRLLRMPNGANFSVPGAGKTTTTLIVWAALRYQKKVEKLLVIAPRSAFEAWHKDNIATFKEKYTSVEFSDERIESATDILIVNYEKLQNQTKLHRLVSWVETNNAMVVVDEAHRIKGGSNSTRWHSVKEVCSKAKRVDLLTGTPMPQGFQDLKNLYSISWPKISTNHFSVGLLSSAKRGGIFVRTTKTELNLPEPTLKEITIPMGKIQTDVYSALRKNYAGSFALNQNDESFMARKGKAVFTLIAVASNPGLLSEIKTEDSYLGLEWPPRDFNIDNNLLDLISNYVSHEIPPKYKWVTKYLEKASKENRKVLVWSNFVGNLQSLHKLLKPFSPAIIHGEINDQMRKQELYRFRHDPDCHVLLTNPQTLGEGVSLHHECHDAIYIDRIYNAGLYLQSVDRIHRLGLPENQETRIFILQSDKSIDHRVNISLTKKIERMGNALNDPGLAKSSIPVELDEIIPSELLDLDQIDLDGIYKHLSDG